MNHVVLVGRLTRNPELRYIQGTGTPIANFAIAVDREFLVAGKKETDFIDIQVWGKSAENCTNYISKGSLVAVQGSLRIDNFLHHDEKRKSAKINANRVKFLDTKSRSDKTQETQFQPKFTPDSLDPQGWNAINDDDIPF